MRWYASILVLSLSVVLAGCMGAGRSPYQVRNQVDTYLRDVSQARDRGIVLAYEGKVDDALLEMKGLVAHGRQQFGADSGLAALAVMARGIVLREARRYDEAVIELNVSLAAFERSDGATSSIVGSNLSALALTYQYMGRFPEAEPLRQRALEIAEKDKGAESDAAGLRWGEMAEMLIGLGRYVEADEAQQKSRALLEKAGRTDWVAFLVGLQRQSTIYGLLDRRDEMEAPLRRLVSLTEPGLPKLSIYALRAQLALGGYLTDQGRFDEAEAAYRKALDAVATAPETRKVSHLLLLHAMADLKEKQGNAEQAADYRRQAKAIAPPEKTS